MPVGGNRFSLSRLRLSEHYGALTKFHASEVEPARLRIQAADGNACEEVTQICKHLDLEYEILPAPAQGSGGSLRWITIRRSNLGAPDEQDEEQAKDVQCGEPQNAAGDTCDEPLPAPAPETATGGNRRGDHRLRVVVEAERLLEVAPHGLNDFYHSVVDTFPGHHAQLARLLVERLRAAGASLPGSSSSSSSSSSSASSSSDSAARRKRKRLKHQAKKRKKEKRNRMEVKPEDQPVDDV